MAATSSYHRVAVIRAKEIWLRIGLAAVIGMGGAAVTKDSWIAALWFAAVVVVQAVDLRITARMRRDPNLTLTRLQEAGYLAWIAFTVSVYEALRTRRPHRPAFNKQQALRLMTTESQGQFDPTLLTAFVSVAAGFDEIFQSGDR